MNTRLGLLCLTVVLALCLLYARVHPPIRATVADSIRSNSVHSQLDVRRFPISQLLAPYVPPAPTTVLWNPADPAQLPPQSPVRSGPSYEIKNQSAPTYSDQIDR